MENLKYLFKSLFSNKTIVEGRHKPWYFAIIFFILGVVLTWIPVLTSGYTTNNSTFFTSSSSQEADRGLNYMLSQQYFQEGITIAEDPNDSDKLALNLTGVDSFARDDTWNNEYDGVIDNGKPLIRAEFTDNNDSFLHNNIAPTN